MGRNKFKMCAQKVARVTYHGDGNVEFFPIALCREQIQAHPSSRQGRFLMDEFGKGEFKPYNTNPGSLQQTLLRTGCTTVKASKKSLIITSVYPYYLGVRNIISKYDEESLIVDEYLDSRKEDEAWL